MAVLSKNGGNMTIRVHLLQNVTKGSREPERGGTFAGVTYFGITENTLLRPLHTK